MGVMQIHDQGGDRLTERGAGLQPVSMAPEFLPKVAE
jgi:hypothetical protein